MATLDRKVPSPNTFLCKPWSAYAAEAVKIQNSDIAHVEDTGKDLGTASEARKLNREDMHLYGQYPAYDEFCLVVCNICSQVVKPQGILSHYERRHAPFSDARAPLSQKPKVPFSSSYRPPRDGEHPPFTRPPHSVYPPKGARAKPCVSVPVVSLEKMSCLSRTEGPHVRLSYPPSSSSTSPSSSSPAASSARPPPHKPQDRVLNGRVPPSAPPHTPDRRPSPAPSPSPTNPDRRPVPSPSCSLDRQPPAPPPPPPPPPPLPLDRKQQNGTKSTKPYKRVSGRVFDPNKHCGVLDPESKKPCTRSLTCKTHSLTHRRAVPGRGKHFDSLLAEHKGRHLREQQASHAHPTRPAQSHEPASSPSTEFQEARPTSLLKSKLANSHIPRPLGGCSTSASQSSSVGPPPDTPLSCPRVETGDRLSSEEGEGETNEDVDCPYTTRHPRPMGCCAFGSRLMGRGYYVFDRRWDRMRRALHVMVEKHVSTQMWRKVPLAAEGRTHHPPAPPNSTSRPPPLLPSPAPTAQSNSVSMVTYSTAFPHVGGTGGVFSIVDSASLLPPVPALTPLFPAPPRQPRSRPSKPPKPCEPPPRGRGGGAVGGAAGGGWTVGGASGGGWAVGGVVGNKKRKSPPTTTTAPYSGPHRKSSQNATPPPTSHQSGPALSSNGTSPLGAKTLPPGHGLPRPLPPFPGDPALFARADGRKRKSSSPVGRPAKSPKITAALNSVYRPPSGSEPAHPTLPRQPKVHH